MKNDAVRKVANYKHPAKLQSFFRTYVRNQPYRSLPVVNWRGLLNSIDHCTVPGQFSNASRRLFNCGVHGKLLSNYLRMIFFICNFWICTISHKSVSNVVNYSIWRKMGYQNVDEKKSHKRLCQLCHRTITRYEIRTPHISAEFLFWGV